MSIFLGDLMLSYDQISLCRDLNKIYEEPQNDNFTPYLPGLYFNTPTKPILQTDYG